MEGEGGAGATMAWERLDALVDKRRVWGMNGGRITDRAEGEK